jgi:hypothetical protein
MSLFPLPKILAGRITPAQYEKWLGRKAERLRIRDKKEKRPYAFKASIAVYKALIHLAAVNTGELDPYTGERLCWELISTWDTSHEQPQGYERKFALLPTVDHVNPDVLEFEICSWKINKAKSDLGPAEFVELCKKVAGYRLKIQR